VISIKSKGQLPQKAKRHLRVEGGKTVITKRIPNLRMQVLHKTMLSKRMPKGHNKAKGRAVEKAMHNRMPRNYGSRNAAERIENNLKHESPWFNSIMDPLTGADVKIPDETGVPTGTMQVCFRRILTADAEGYAGFRIISPYPNSEPGGINGPGCNYQIVKAATVGPEDLVWAATRAAADYSCHSMPGLDSLTSFARGVRVVSGSVTLQPEMSGLNDQGEMIPFQVPFDAAFDGTAVPISEYLNLYESAIVPVNTKKAAISRWYPYHRDQMNYKSFIDTGKTSLGPNDEDCPLWTFGVVAHGLAAGSALIAQIAINYEFLPKQSILNIVDASPSCTDSMDHELTLKYVQDEPKSGTVPAHEVDRAPASANPSQDEVEGETGFGMFANVLKEIVPEVLPILGSLL
jgi:hypothetical protein